jgi:hypothetical protein
MKPFLGNVAATLRPALPPTRRRWGAGGRLQHDVADCELAGVSSPLTADELLTLLQSRWRASYDLQLVQRRGRLYLQVMWAYLEQQSFPLTPEQYDERLAQLAGALNDLGVAEPVRQWLATTTDKPRLGKALTLPLAVPSQRLSEFLL